MNETTDSLVSIIHEPLEPTEQSILELEYFYFLISRQAQNECLESIENLHLTEFDELREAVCFIFNSRYPKFQVTLKKIHTIQETMNECNTLVEKIKKHVAKIPDAK